MAEARENINESEILSYWHDLKFPGSYTGVKTFQTLLKTDLNINISEKKLYDILKNDSIFLIHQIKRKHVNRRPYITHHYGEIVQADLSYMFSDPESKSEKYFLLVIDVYSNKIFVEVLENKTGVAVAKCLQKVFTNFGSPVYKLETDKGSEFVSKEAKLLYKKLHIFHKTKRGLHKASFAEAAIKRVKRRLFMALRSKLSQHWTKFIQQIVQNINSTPLKRIGYLTPSEINSEEDSVLVDKALTEHHLKIPTDATYKEQKQNEENYKNSSQNLQVDDYVYIRFKDEPMTKSFDFQVRCLRNFKQTFTL